VYSYGCHDKECVGVNDANGISKYGEYEATPHTITSIRFQLCMDKIANVSRKDVQY